MKTLYKSILYSGLPIVLFLASVNVALAGGGVVLGDERIAVWAKWNGWTVIDIECGGCHFVPEDPQKTALEKRFTDQMKQQHENSIYPKLQKKLAEGDSIGWNNYSIAREKERLVVTEKTSQIRVVLPVDSMILPDLSGKPTIYVPKINEVSIK